MFISYYFFLDYQLLVQVDIQTVCLTYPFCQLKQSRVFLVYKYFKYFVDLWFCQHGGFYFQATINVAILVSNVFQYFCAVFFVVFKITNMVLPSFFFESPHRWAKIVFVSFSNSIVTFYMKFSTKHLLFKGHLYFIQQLQSISFSSSFFVFKYFR